MSLRCAVAGLNRGARFVELLRANADCEVVAVCDTRPEKLAEHPDAEGFQDFERMLAEAQPHLVAIITPGPLHAPQALAALQAGAHVLVETPNVYSAQQAQEIVDLARQRDLNYMLAEDYIYMGWCQRLEAAVEDGMLGEIIGGMAEYTHDCRPVRPLSAADERHAQSWRFTDLPPLAYCSHTLGPLLHLMDDRCISATGIVGGRQEIAGVDVFPLETAVLQTEGGRTISLTNGFMLSHPFIWLAALYGTEGSVRVITTDYGDPDALRVLISTDDEPGWRDWPMPWHEREDGRDHLQVMVDDFVDSVLSDTPPPFDEARSMDFCLPGVLAHQSAKRGGVPLEVPLF
ncbi:MAG: Gfo/Idh/MocA family oxidoreductase [Armatimonadota bacterium]|nr:Gfo/Idh/MocA family oxidoreductase [Armatimonadota bacterium]